MKTKFLKSSGGELAFEDRGTGPLVVCVPGMGDQRSQYRFLAPALAAAGRRVVSMDLRGHGESTVGWADYGVAAVGNDMLDLIRGLGAGPAVIVGNSMAAGAAVWAAVEAPELVRGIVMIGPAVRGTLGLGLRLLVRLLFARPWGAKAWLRYFRGLFPNRLPADWEDYSAALERNLSERGRLEALHAMMKASKWESESRLDRVKVPVLVVMGRRDPDFKNPGEEADWVASRAGGTVRMVDDAGHYPHVELPESTIPTIVGFLETLLEAKTDAAPLR